jgi:hypothetical protein
MSDHYDRYNGMEELLGTNLAEVGTDCISRQAAIKATWKDTGYTDPFNVMTAIRDRIEQLPPAEPQIIRCKDCKHYKYGMCMKICANKSTNGFCDWGERTQ